MKTPAGSVINVVMAWQCHICQEPSEEICPACTKDVCANHICEHCRRCIDCCICKEELAPHIGREHVAAADELPEQ